MLSVIGCLNVLPRIINWNFFELAFIEFSLNHLNKFTISHHGISNRFHLNSRGLHLNDKGATCLAQNFKKFLSDIEFG